MAGKDGLVEITSTMKVSQEDWDKIFPKTPCLGVDAKKKTEDSDKGVKE